MTQFSFGKQTRFFAAAVLTAVLGLLACSAGRADDWLAGNNNDYPVNTIESVRAAIEDMIDRGVMKRRRPLNAWPQEDLDLMYEMRMQGKTFGEIADRLGRSYKACTEQFRRIYG